MLSQFPSDMICTKCNLHTSYYILKNPAVWLSVYLVCNSLILLYMLYIMPNVHEQVATSMCVSECQ